MNYKEFREEVKQHIKEYLPEDWNAAEVLIKQCSKNNGIHLYGLTILKTDSGISPQIYLEDAYRLYSGGASMEETLKRLGTQYLKANRSTPEVSAANFTYEMMKDRLILCAVNAEKNQEQLSTVPNQRVEDLAIVYRCILHEDESGFGSVLVNNTLLDFWGITKETLHEQAEANMKHRMPYELHSMEYVIADMTGIPFQESKDSMKDSAMFVLSNSKKWQGASYLFYPEVLEAVSKELGGSFLILPSSIHELILIRQNQEISTQEMRDMVCEVNRSQVAIEERLSDEVYQYEAETGKMSMVPEEGMQQGMHFGM